MALIATPTRNVRDTLHRTITLVQRSNSWCQSSYLEQEKDSTGKTRSKFCLKGAIRAAVTGSTAKADESNVDGNRVLRATEKRIIKTLKANPTRYGLKVRDTGAFSDESISSAVGFNDTDGIKHKNVLALLRDTVISLN